MALNLTDPKYLALKADVEHLSTAIELCIRASNGAVAETCALENLFNLRAAAQKKLDAWLASVSV